MSTPADVAAAGQLACLLEVSAPKPGNVSPGLHFHDTRYEDFLASAVAIGPALSGAAEHPLGTTIRTSVEATRRWTRSNTNLGIVLLLAPLARAALRSGGSLRERLAVVLKETTVTDAAQVYAAIRHAGPGGLGASSAEDVSDTPTVTLRDAMALAADRDAVAREYVTDFALTFEVGVPAVRAGRQEGLGWTEAAVEAYLTLLASTPDTHIARKLGQAEAESVSRSALEVREVGGTRSAAGRKALAALDAELRDPRNRRNPGTTADLTCAALFVVILEGGWDR
ncbi:MAG: triphosphoribosyl-dephospho-CoA synthase [Gemmatimonadota bacterium]|nr:triphosphoribosyl-dephospho-CoA synthase [Gemmatimonadales bacterium]MDQ3208698.1 triphosphoribosyl-dephospho-CoA synthase [Gemmatimonadota bacterium]